MHEHECCECVERLRARNELLETLHTFVRASDPAYQSLSVAIALDALDHSETPNGSGGDPPASEGGAK